MSNQGGQMFGGYTNMKKNAQDAGAEAEEDSQQQEQEQQQEEEAIGPDDVPIAWMPYQPGQLDSPHGGSSNGGAPGGVGGGGESLDAMAATMMSSIASVGSIEELEAMQKRILAQAHQRVMHEDTGAGGGAGGRGAGRGRGTGRAPGAGRGAGAGAEAEQSRLTDPSDGFAPSLTSSAAMPPAPVIEGPVMQHWRKMQALEKLTSTPEGRRKVATEQMASRYRERERLRTEYATLASKVGAEEALKQLEGQAFEEGLYETALDGTYDRKSSKGKQAFAESLIMEPDRKSAARETHEQTLKRMRHLLQQQTRAAAVAKREVRGLLLQVLVQSGCWRGKKARCEACRGVRRERRQTRAREACWEC
jgi:hypothetical protein